MFTVNKISTKFRFSEAIQEETSDVHAVIPMRAISLEKNTKKNRAKVFFMGNMNTVYLDTFQNIHLNVRRMSCMNVSICNSKHRMKTDNLKRQSDYIKINASIIYKQNRLEMCN